jgi:hypothetical protein
MTYPEKNSLTFSGVRNIVKHTQEGNKPTLTGAKTMTVSAIASGIYQAAKKAAKDVWEWRAEWSKAMKKARRKVMNKEARCTKEIWNTAASIHTRGLAGLQKIIQTVGRQINATTGQEVMDHLYQDFLAKKDNYGAAKHFGLYLNLWHK